MRRLTPHAVFFYRYGHKNDHQAGRTICWVGGIGYSILSTEIFLARGQEQQLVRAHKAWLSNMPKGTIIIVDRGFDKSMQYYPNFNYHVLPSFKRRRKRVQQREVRYSREVAKDRYIGEVYNARVKSQKLIKGHIERHRFRYVNHTFNWGHAMSNLYKPLKNPADWEDYLSRQVEEAREPLV